MKKKGFTLVELLATIVVLSVIALIATPIILNVIEKAKKGALVSSVNGLVESANMYYTNEIIKGDISEDVVFDFEGGVQTSDKKLEYKGKVENGKLILYAAGEIAVCIDDTEHYAYKNKDTDEIISGVGTCKYDGTTGKFSSNSPTEELEKQIASTTAEAKDVLEGKTIYKTNGIVTGTMANKSGTTTAATTITENGDNAEITIPANGYYSTSSKISVPIATVNSILSLNTELYASASGTGDTQSGVDAYLNTKLSKGLYLIIGEVTYNSSNKNVSISVDKNALLGNEMTVDYGARILKAKIIQVVEDDTTLIVSCGGAHQDYAFIRCYKFT